MIVEAAVIVLLSTLVLWPVRRLLLERLDAIPRRYALFCVASLASLLVGHVASRGEATYPLTAWDMYTVSNPSDPRFVDYLAELSTGQEVRLLMGQLFPSGGRHFRARIDEAAYAVDEAPSSQVAAALAHLDDMLAAVTEKYTAQHPGDSIRAIRLWIGTVPARHYSGPASISRRLLHEYRTP